MLWGVGDTAKVPSATLSIMKSAADEVMVSSDFLQHYDDPTELEFVLTWAYRRFAPGVAFADTNQQRTAASSAYLEDLRRFREAVAATPDDFLKKLGTSMIALAESRQGIARPKPSAPPATNSGDDVARVRDSCDQIAAALGALKEVRALSPVSADMLFNWKRWALEWSLSSAERNDVQTHRQSYIDFLDAMERNAQQSTDEGAVMILARVRYARAVLAAEQAEQDISEDKRQKLLEDVQQTAESISRQYSEQEINLRANPIVATYESEWINRIFRVRLKLAKTQDERDKIFAEYKHSSDLNFGALRESNPKSVGVLDGIQRWSEAYVLEGAAN